MSFKKESIARLLKGGISLFFSGKFPPNQKSFGLPHVTVLYYCSFTPLLFYCGASTSQFQKAVVVIFHQNPKSTIILIAIYCIYFKNHIIPFCRLKAGHGYYEVVCFIRLFYLNYCTVVQYIQINNAVQYVLHSR